MAGRSRIEVPITGDATDLVKAGKQAEKALDGIEGAAEKAGKGLEKSLGAAGSSLTVSLLAAGAAAVATAIDFDNSFGQIEGLVGISGDALTDLKDKTLALAPTVGIGPGSLAKGLYFLTSAGLDAAQSMDTLEASSKAAAASGAQVETIADAAASAVNAYAKEGLSGARAVDILTAGVKFGKTEFEGFSAAVGKVIPIAAAAGVGFDEVTAAMSALSLTGSDAAEAGTQVRAFIQAIVKPSKEAALALGGENRNPSEDLHPRRNHRRKGRRAIVGSGDGAAGKGELHGNLAIHFPIAKKTHPGRAAAAFRHRRLWRGDGDERCL